MRKKILLLLITTITAISLLGCAKSEYAKYINVGDYKNLELTDNSGIQEETYTDEDVNNHIRTTICLENPDLIKETNAPIEDGNCVSFEGTITNSDGTESNFSLSNRMVSELSEIDGLKEGVIGHSVGEELEIPLSVGDEKMTAKIKITSVAEDPINYFNDEWVKTYDKDYNTKTTSEYKKAIKKHLKEEAETTNKSSKISVIVNDIMKNASVKEYPENSVNNELKSVKAQYKKMEEIYNVNIKENIMTNNNISTDDDYNKFLKSIAKEQVKTNLVFNRIAELEKIKPSEDEYKEKIKEYKKVHKDSYDSYDVIGEEKVRQYILNEIVEDWLYEHNTVTYRK